MMKAVENDNLLMSEQMQLCASNVFQCWLFRMGSQKRPKQEKNCGLVLKIPRSMEVLKLSENSCVLGISDDESWWLFSEQDGSASEDYLAQLRDLKSTCRAALIEQSAAYQCFDFFSPDSSTLLSHLIPYDWSSMPCNKVVSSMMKSVPIVVFRLNEANRFHLLVRRSFSEYAVAYIRRVASLL